MCTLYVHVYLHNVYIYILHVYIMYVYIHMYILYTCVHVNHCVFICTHCKTCDSNVDCVASLTVVNEEDLPIRGHSSLPVCLSVEREVRVHGKKLIHVQA